MVFIVPLESHFYHLNKWPVGLLDINAGGFARLQLAEPYIRAHKGQKSLNFYSWLIKKASENIKEKQRRLKLSYQKPCCNVSGLFYFQPRRRENPARFLCFQKFPCGNRGAQAKTMMYSRLLITRTFKRNRKKFELSGARRKLAGRKEKKTVFTAQWTF